MKCKPSVDRTIYQTAVVYILKIWTFLNVPASINRKICNKKNITFNKSLYHSLSLTYTQPCIMGITNFFTWKFHFECVECYITRVLGGIDPISCLAWLTLQFTMTTDKCMFSPCNLQWHLINVCSWFIDKKFTFHFVDVWFQIAHFWTRDTSLRFSGQRSQCSWHFAFRYVLILISLRYALILIFKVRLISLRYVLILISLKYALILILYSGWVKIYFISLTLLWKRLDAELNTLLM